MNNESPEHLMRILLRDCRNGKYFQAPAQWAASPNAARDFFGTGQALQAAKDNCLENVQVVLSFGKPQTDVILPLIP